MKDESRKTMTLGVVSDTHGFLDPKVFNVFSDVDLILHAGDIGHEDVITALETIAPVRAVHGNVDGFPLCERYPAVYAEELAGVVFCMVHERVDPDSRVVTDALATVTTKPLDVLIYGHSHLARLERVGEVLLLNPGSAGRPRFSLRPAVARITIEPDKPVAAEIIYLDRQP
ncbi:MAG: metallophosphoesterase [Calditrichaeota bacterium]|nr:MAG: metallophosphoesterase [Calditrichota bacterium]